VCDSRYTVTNCGNDCLAIESPECQQCYIDHPATVGGVPIVYDCDSAPDVTLQSVPGGPPAGTSKAAICRALVDCMYDTGCHVDGASDCYCGTGDCASGGANGPCLLWMQAAAEGTLFDEVGARFANLSYAIGWATNRIDTGRISGCTAVCSEP
jgi:hypothetical protein